MLEVKEENPVLLSIVIVNYNGKRFIPDCLRSVRKFVACSHEVIIVDNASVDDSAEFIQTNYPNARFIQSEKNLGFTGGNNLGAAVAKGELLLLLNNDTVILNNIQPALDRFRDPAVGIVGSHLFYADLRNQPSIGYELSPLRLSLSWFGLSSVKALPTVFRMIETNPAFYEVEQHHVAWVSGAFLVTRRALWNRLGGLDEVYFMYVEDVDYCKRVRLAGYVIDYLPQVKVLHYEGAGKAWIGEMALLRTMRSYLIFLRKFHSGLGSLFARFSLGSAMVIRSIFYCLSFIVRKDTVTGEKMRAYFKAARYLFLSKNSH